MEENIDPIIQHESSMPSNLFGKVFTWMFLGVLATAIVALYTYTSELYIEFISNNTFEILLIVELVVVFVFSLLFRKMPPILVGILFFVYAIINGLTMSVIFACFSISSIVYVFFAAALIFGICAIYGYKTQADLLKIGNIFMITLFVAIIVSIINMFLGLSWLDIIIDWVVLLLFFGITAYDMQKIKALAISNVLPSDKVHIYGAMELYLDFINIFLRVLSLFGKRRD